jgi:competence protein ComEA
VPERSGSTIAIWVVAAVLGVVAAVRLLGGGGGEAPPVSVDGGAGAGGATAGSGAGGATAGSGAGAGDPYGSGAGPSGSAAGSSAGSAGALYVHVAGAVHRPGLIRVPPGTRVATALERAGGPARRADLTLVNLAARVQDGQQIVVPLAGAPAGAGGGSPASGAAAGGAMPGLQIHLSTATPEQLDEVDGIGPTLAAAIIEYRDAHGGFRSLDELSEVDGIGEERLKALREALQP